MIAGRWGLASPSSQEEAPKRSGNLVDEFMLVLRFLSFPAALTLFFSFFAPISPI